MDYLFIILFFTLIFSLTLSYLKMSVHESINQRINNMGIGYNLGNSFDCYDENVIINKPDDQITLKGNAIPTKKLISNIKKNGFKTIRFPITWTYFIDESGKVNSNWMVRVKEVVDWIIDYNMYCIINVHHDGKPGNWLSKGMDSKNKYDSLWTQIAKEFRDYNDYLVFESMNEVEFKSGNNYDYETLFNLTQSFIDIVRSSGGKNSERLLIIAGANAQYDLSISDDFKIPTDPANNFAISLHYYNPYRFTKEPADENSSVTKWGNSDDYDEIMMNFYIMKMTFPDNGIPIILTEVGVLTEDKKEEESLREFLYVVFALAWEFDGILPILWDTSNKNTGDMNYYDRENNAWYDNKIIHFLSQISKGRFVSMWDHFIDTNKENFTEDINEDFDVDIDGLTLQKIIFNMNFNENFTQTDIEFSTFDINGDKFIIPTEIIVGKKQYDGTITYMIDVSHVECYEFVYINLNKERDNIVFNYFTFEFLDQFALFDYKEYKNEVNFNIYKN